MVFPYGLVTVDSHKIAALSGELAVKGRCGHFDSLALGKAGGSLADSGENYGEMFVEFVLYYIENLFLVGVNLVPQGLALVERERFDIGTEFVGGFFVGLCGGGDIGAHRVDAVTEAVVVELLYFGNFLLHSLEYGSYSFKVAA